jgi:N-acetylglucosamine kinase-like BadF-type ATPase
MILVADSGSTKADWKYVADNEQFVSTRGFNPFFHDHDFILTELKASPLRDIVPEVTEVYFYGAGCSSPDRNAIVERALQAFFTEAKIVVGHDILGAAIATNFDAEGITCIIGTGSNSCHYDGKNWDQTVPALGYLLGDEASGSYLGRQLLADYLYKLLPPAVEKHLNEKYNLSKEIIFHQTYHEPNVNVYLASFARVLSEHLQEPYVQQVVKAGFRRFFEVHVMRYPKVHELPIHFVGSIAHHFEPLLDEVMAEKKLLKGKILKKPVHELYRYFMERAR